MVIELRSGRKVDLVVISNTVMNNSGLGSSGNGLSELDKVLKPLETSILMIQNSIAALRSFFACELDKIRSRLNILESRCAMNETFVDLQLRKRYDNEQYSRKTNLRLSNIIIENNETPGSLMEKIQYIVSDCDVNTSLHDYDRCHRIGKKYKNKGNTCQDVLLRLVTWTARDKIYQKRKQLPFKVFADLTTRRSDILVFATTEARDDRRTNQLVKYVFCDVNCKLKVCSTSNKFFAFNSENEFFNIVTKLDMEATASHEFLEDERGGIPSNESPYDLFY